MPHTYECQMRWADMDMLGHVNNVTYLDYVAEARDNLLPDSAIGRAPVTRHHVEFVAPLVFRRRPVLVDSWVTDLTDERVTLAHEVFDAPSSSAGDRTVYVRVVTELAVAVTPSERERLKTLSGPAPTWPPAKGEARTGGHVYPLTVRRADVDEHGHVRDAAFFEYFQEARITFLMSLHTRGQKWSHHVVARTDIEYLAAVRHRGEPYAVRSWISHVGTKSFTIQAELLDGDQAMARVAVVMVTFDKETQRPQEMAASQRERLLQELAQPS